jgi:hypothetical protein
VKLVGVDIQSSYFNCMNRSSVQCLKMNGAWSARLVMISRSGDRTLIRTSDRGRE